ncbi:allophanate hydrolase subunit 2-domain-containing protein [Fusarium oxysporum Fo47]|uniref:allophanate hydrolase subunit 2-domain-containing protein n=1 Tax=Fusarium oxysporum Fo47 TaxID=660027 RepID=UPI002869D878|nr:allophanate hydrolase subunit 2-domain-containing protein [Fusarium oxysporum Fo47]QKD58822.2 allophanate hydrolase subunit 2-domain-containing protein [Fusarium oxysporum Fo47]
MTELDTAINGWRSAQIRGDGIERLLSLISIERAANSTTNAWISLASSEQIKAQWTSLQTLCADSMSLPLYGVPFAAKDNINAEGFITTAACPTFSSSPATSDATVVAKLKAAGAILIGKTNLDQFATGLVGTRSPYGAVPNSFDPSRVSGGSSSGSAVVVARSGRVPAGTHGVLPACKSLDCVSIFTLTVGDAETALSVAEGYDIHDAYSRERPDPDIAPYNEFGGSANWFGRDGHSPAYDKALAKAKALGWSLVPLLYNGPWVAERYEAIRGFIENAAAKEMDPVVRKIIIRAQSLSAADVFEGEYLRQELTRQIEREFARFDGLLLVKNPVEENSILGTYTNFVNFLDWSALSIPAGFRPDGLPFEPFLLSWAREWFGDEERLLGATGVRARESRIAASSAPSNYIPIAVDTSSSYRLYSLNIAAGPKKPGLKRVEVWNLPKTSLASFMLTITPPLAIGSIELKDGSWVKGFVCEPCGFDEAVDITSHGGWRVYHAFLEKGSKFLTNGVPNRGEIAVRIIETIHKMGLRAVAIYSEIDADAAHVSKADLALKLEGSSVSETYLDMEQILKLAVQSSADAIIPGYGFLSENAEFATAVEERDMIWIGPTPQQMADLGLKHRARAIAVEAGVPTVPGCDTLLTSLEEALKEGERIGFPLMLKSTAGGGGIGLSYCKDRQSLATTFEGVQRQAEANFGNGGVFIERFIQRARHVEVQVLGDGTGRVIAAGERDCSLQRRHQKVVEESPAILVPESIRAEMRAAAIRLASSVKYRNVGTVEFIYDIDSREFYFLEVNTRLQVEHPVTESVTGLDLVECMINVADGNATHLFDTELKVSGASIEVRVYAESPLQSFRPCAGRITALEFPPSLRVDTWIQLGTEITTAFDPLVAKLIALGSDREEAIENLAKGLAATRIEGVQTNLEYLRQIIASPMFKSGDYTTKSLDSFQFHSSSFEVLQPGALTTVQEYPGRTGYWNIGIPPGGPMDSYSFRLANRLVGNPSDAAGLECTLGGPSLKFHCDAVIAAVGGVAQVTIDDVTVSMNQAIGVEAGQILSIGVIEHGHRVYLAIRGGIEVPVVMGSRATFELGKLGGFGGRKLQARDILAAGPADASVSEAQAISPVPVPTHPKASWTIRVIPGPHGAPDYFTPQSVRALYLSNWKVHHNSNRLGVRLTGPQPEWSRKSGGEAGLHPSNIHDAPYSIGSVSFTGDEAVVLGCDGPSLGGFVMGQVRPGDTIRFDPVDVATAIGLERDLDKAIETLSPLEALEGIPSDEAALVQKLGRIPAAIGTIKHDGQRVTVLQAGDRAFLLEFGDASAFNLRHNFEISAFCENHEKKPIPGVEELTPGVFSLHVTYTRGLSPELMLSRLADHIRSYKVPSQVPSRSVRLPIAFDDSISRAAIERYTATIRPNAPWLPSNIDFLQKLNGIPDLTEVLSAAEFVVLGLGDVFMGSPCAIPLDPRHRLFGTKYNPSRSFTPRGAVGIGGQYMCIYATDSPGGYQLVGRTVEIWDADLVDTEAWFFRRFDRISFYPVTEAALDGTARSELVQISDGVLDLEQYETWLTTNKEDITAAADQQARAISNAPFVDELVLPYQVEPVVNGHSPSLDSSGLRGERVKATMPGRCYKVMVKEGSVVEKGDVLVCIESSKMEVEIRSPVGGKCVAVLVQAGDLIDVEDELVVVE